MIYMRILDDINRTVTDAIFVDVLQQCSKAGLGGANDIRNFEKTRMLTDVICVLRATWEFFDSGLPGMKDQKEPYHEDDFLRLGKLLETSVEDLVLAITLTGDQYEDPVTWGAVEAMNRLFTTGFAQNPQVSDKELMAKYKDDDSKARKEAEKAERKKGKKKAQNGSSSSAPVVPEEEKKEEKGLGVAWRDGRVFDGDGKETAQSAMRTHIQQQQQQNYISVEWVDRSPHMTDPQRCNLLAERLRPLMPSKHSLATVQSFIRNLYHETVDDVNRPGQSVPVIAWPESQSQDGKTRTCLIAKSLLSNNKQDRLVSILSKILDKEGMPDLEYITGVPEMRTPFVLLTVIPDHVREARAKADAKKDDAPSDFSAFNASLSGKDEKKNEAKQKRPPKKRGKYMIRDPGWVDQGVSLFVRRAITYDMDEDQRDAILRKSATDLFRQPWVEIDCDIEEYGTYRGMSNTFTTFATLEQLGFGDLNRATRTLIRRSRHKAYQDIPTFDVLLQYPDCFHSREPKFLEKERWRNKRGDDGKRAPATEDSLDKLRNTRIPTNLGMETSRFRANVDPSYRETREFAQYQQKTKSIHHDTALLHAQLLRSSSVRSAAAAAPSMSDQLDEKHNTQDEDDAMLEALEAVAGQQQQQPEDNHEPLRMEPDNDDDDATRSGFEPSVMDILWGRS